MCTYFYVHYHHQAPCPHPVAYVATYVYCDRATPAAADDQGTSTKTPCANVSFDLARGNVDLNNPCGSSACLPSISCQSGECRFADLGRCWKCCRCGGGENRFKTCYHSRKNCPDTFCYHIVCWQCEADGLAVGQ